MSLSTDLPSLSGTQKFVAVVLLAVGAWSDCLGQQRTAGDSTVLIVVGSESLAPVVQLWTEDLERGFPGTALRVQASGSGTASASLADAAADVAAMSRVMDATEVDAFVRRRGFRPTPIRVALDAVTVLVNAANPIRGLDLAQVDAIFSVDRRCGGVQDITSWGQVAPTGVWLSRPIQAFGPGVLSGTRAFFRESALCGGQLKPGMMEMPDSRAVVQAVGDSANAIGFGAMAFRGPAVKALPIAPAGSGRFIEPNAVNALSGAYPLTRYLYLHVAKPAGSPLPVPVQQFATLALSAQGQKRVAQAGYVPLPPDVALQEMKKLH